MSYFIYFVKTQHDSVCWNIQYKAIMKLSAEIVFHKKVYSVLLEICNLAMVTPIYKN